MSEQLKKMIATLPRWAVVAFAARTTRELVPVCKTFAHQPPASERTVATRLLQILRREPRVSWPKMADATASAVAEAEVAAGRGRSDLGVEESYGAAVLASRLAQAVPFLPGCHEAHTAHKVASSYVVNAARSHASSWVAAKHGWEAAARMQGPLGSRLARAWQSGPDQYTATGDLESEIALEQFAYSIAAALVVVTPKLAARVSADATRLSDLATQQGWSDQTPVASAVFVDQR